MEVSIIALITDFGLKDPYVAEMKAVILNICPKAEERILINNSPMVVHCINVGC